MWWPVAAGEQSVEEGGLKDGGELIAASKMSRGRWFATEGAVR